MSANVQNLQVIVWDRGRPARNEREARTIAYKLEAQP
jgi:hypothetical protein